jgi:hypothetical protein
MLVAGLFVVLATSVASAADKDEDKAREATRAFLRAVKTKDIDTVMKTVDAPFAVDFGHPSAQTFEKTDDVKAALKKILEKVMPDKIPVDVGKVYDMTSFGKLAKEMGAKGLAEAAEKFVGKTGFAVTLKDKEDGTEEGGVLVRIKDGKAYVAGMLK